MSEQVERSVLSLALKPCASAPTERNRGTNRRLARNALALFLVTVPATATPAKNDSQSANSIMPGCNAWIAQLGRGSTALGSNVFLAGECLRIVGTFYISHATFPFHQPPARLPTTNGAMADCRFFRL